MSNVSLACLPARTQASALSDAATLLQQHRQEAVILITSHNANGTRGIILNRPTSLRLEQTLIRSETGRTSIRQLFPESRLYMGGAHVQEAVEIIHSRRDVWEESEMVLPGVFSAASSVPDDLEARLESRGCTMADRTAQFKFFCGSESWKPGELELEVRDGLWTVASASPAMVAKHCLQLPVPLWLEISLRIGGQPAEDARRAYANLLSE